jgi:transcriptional regulator with XRE-family HTH domain
LNQKVVDACQKAKSGAYPKITNQDIVDETGLSPSTVNNFLRGATKDPPLGTAGPICKMLGVSLDDCCDIDAPVDPTELQQAVQELTQKLQEANTKIEISALKLKHAREQLATYRALAWIFGILVLLAMGALLIDLSNLGVGWIRGPIEAAASAFARLRGGAL